MNHRLKTVRKLKKVSTCSESIIFPSEINKKEKHEWKLMNVFTVKKSAADHCEFFPYNAPEKCKCFRRGWMAPDKIGKICDKFDGGKGKDRKEYACGNCEHDYECHRKIKRTKKLK